MRRSIAAVGLACALTLVGCGVSTQDEPEDLPVTSPPSPTTATVTVRPELPTSSPLSPAVPPATTTG